MRILLVHNPKAGSEGHEGDELMELLAAAGHKAVYQSARKKELRKALKKKIDLVLVAGGDGTVGKVARRLMGSNIPLSVLPLGTANNLARTLGFLAPAEELIARLADGVCEGFDTGRARGPWGKRDFLEGVGAGLFADYLYEFKRRSPKSESGSKAEQMKRHVREMRRRLLRHPARSWQMELDGEDFSGRYLLWQAMNIRSVGPVLRLAPAARTDDGRFDFVGVREEDRGLLLEHLKARLAGGRGKFPLPATRFKKMRLSWKKGPLHFDDQIWPAKDEKWWAAGEIELAVKKSALKVWRSGKQPG